MIKAFKAGFLAFAILSLAGHSMGHDGPEVPEASQLDDLFMAFGWDVPNTVVKSEKISDGLFVFTGIGGNVAVNIGADGVLIVDDQIPQMIPKIKAKIVELGGQGIDYAINTHWHFDHADGNLALADSETIIIAQANSRRMMQSDHLINMVGLSYLQPAYPQGALPKVTFDRSMQLHVNGQKIDLLHFTAAHTTGDAAVIFRGSNAVHMGDVYNTQYPFIDAGNGGSMDGMIAFCQAVLEQIDKTTLVIPGHGVVGSYQDLSDYVDMLIEVRKRMLAMIDQGASLDEIMASGLTSDWDAMRGDSSLFVNRAYQSLTHRIVDR